MDPIKNNPKHNHSNSRTTPSLLRVDRRFTPLHQRREMVKRLIAAHAPVV